MEGGGQLSREEAVHRKGRPFTICRQEDAICRQEEAICRGGRGPVINGGGRSSKGETVRHLLTGGGHSSREGVFNVVGRKNNEILHWEIQNST